MGELRIGDEILAGIGRSGDGEAAATASDPEAGARPVGGADPEGGADSGRASTP